MQYAPLIIKHPLPFYYYLLAAHGRNTILDDFIDNFENSGSKARTYKGIVRRMQKMQLCNEVWIAGELKSLYTEYLLFLQEHGNEDFKIKFYLLVDGFIMDLISIQGDICFRLIYK